MTAAISDKQLRANARRAAAKYHRANATRVEAVEAAKVVAQQCSDAGITDVEIAELFGVDRARTVRRWLGKMVD
jgi:hypothetical protein